MPRWAGWQVFEVTFTQRFPDRKESKHTSAHKPVYKRVRIFIIGELPRGTVEPEGPPCRSGQDRLSIQQVPCGQMGQKGTKLELDPKKLSAFGVRDHASTRPWSDDQEIDVAIESAQDHVPTDLGGTDRRTIQSRSTTCNRFYIRRVRHSFLSDNAHASAPHVSDLTHMREHLGGRLPRTHRTSPAL